MCLFKRNTTSLNTECVNSYIWVKLFFQLVSIIPFFLCGLAVPEPLQRERYAYNGVAVLWVILSSCQSCVVLVVAGTLLENQLVVSIL